LETNGRCYGGAQATDGDRLADYEVHVGGLFVDVLHHGAKACKHDHWNGRIDGLNGFRNLIAVHIGHGTIYNHKIEPTVVELFESVASTVGGLHGMSVDLEVLTDNFTYQWFVIDDKHMQMLKNFWWSRSGGGYRWR
jgi:hypothetical protein